MTNKSKIQILTATSAGVCFGVDRALNLSEKAIESAKGETVYSLGPIIHNPQTVESLKNRGLVPVEKIEDSVGTIVFRSHGVAKDIEAEFKDQGFKIVDATCPLVKVPQNFAKKLSAQGYFVIIVGDENHPEIKGVKSYVENGEVAVIQGDEQVSTLPERAKVGVICQTTLKKSTFEAVVESCRKRFGEVKVHNTICSATRDRQEAAHNLAAKVDHMVVIGGKNSSNTQKLLEICEGYGPSYMVETAEELLPEWFNGASRIGVTAGASTPWTLIEKVKEQLCQLLNGELSEETFQIGEPNLSSNTFAHRTSS